MSDLAIHELGAPAGPTLLLVHGVCDDGLSWPDAVAHWGGAWRILALDQRGHGDSPRFTAEQLAHAPGTWVEDLVEVLSALSEPPVIVAHSLGGLNAMRAAAARPELVRALVLEDPAKPSGTGHADPEVSAGLLTMVQAVAEDPERERRRMARETPWSADEIDAWAESKLRVDRDMLRRGLDLGDAEWEDLVNRLAVPALIAGPRGGAMLPDAGFVTNPLVRIAQLEGVGHCVRRDDPAAYYGLVDAFLAGLPERPGARADGPAAPTAPTGLSVPSGPSGTTGPSDVPAPAAHPID